LNAGQNETGRDSVEVEIQDRTNAGMIEEPDEVEPAQQVPPASRVAACAGEEANLNEVGRTGALRSVGDTVGPGTELRQQLV
jgi:hypothetical protein